ncbi:hypothetical protein BC828DRAFT_404514 [Blastocladiella britannica]|nr:hypothetical protein BC828DRAFT_404514 [Blastocladiella britannica]
MATVVDQINPSAPASGSAATTARTWIPAPADTFGLVVAQFTPPLAPSMPGLGAESLEWTQHARMIAALGHMLPLNVGDIVQVLEFGAKATWIRGYLYSAGLAMAEPPIGIFPAALIAIKYRVNGNGNVIGNGSGDDPLAVSPMSATTATDPASPIPTETTTAITTTATPSGLAMDRIRVADKSIDFAHPESPNQSAENLAPTATDVFGDPEYTSPETQWLSSSGNGNPMHRKSVTDIQQLPAPAYACGDTVIGAEEPVVDEVAYVLRDWYANMRRYLQTQNYIQYAYVKKHMLALLKSRKMLLAARPSATADTLLRHRKDLVTRIATGNGIQTKEQIVRDLASGGILTDKMGTIMRIKDTHAALDAQLRSDGRTGTINVATGAPSSVDADIKSFHILLEVKGVLPELAAAGREASDEFKFAIYSRSDGRYLTDEFTLKRACASGDLTPGIKTLFKDFSSADTTKDNVLVCRVVRSSRLKDHDENQCFRRPIAVGILEIRDILAGKETQPTSGFLVKLYAAKDEANFAQLPTELMSKSGNYEPIKGACVYVSMRSFSHEWHNKASDVLLTHRMGFGDPMDPRAGPRNSLYLTLVSGELSKQLGKSFQVVVSIRDSINGDTIEAMYSTAGQPAFGFHESMVFIHNLVPKWQETIRIDIPAQVMDRAHIHFRIKAVGKSVKPVAFAAKPVLKNNGAVLLDDTHKLTLYKYEQHHVVQGLDTPPSYLPVLAGTASEDQAKKYEALKESITIQTLVVSNTHSQNIALVKMLNWRQAVASSYNDLPSVLMDVKLTPENELIKFVVPVLDALFGIMCSSKNESGSLSRLLFEVLLHLLSVVYHERDRRYIHFRPLIQTYLDTDFNQIGVASHLVDSIVKLIESVRDNSKNTDAIRQLHTVFKSFVHLARIIVQCGVIVRQREAASGTAAAVTGSSTETAELTSEQFQQCLTNLMSSINRLMGDAGDHLSATQQFAFQNFSQVIPLLLKCYSSDFIAQMVITFTDSLVSKRGSIVQKKLTFILSLIRGPLFTANSSTRNTLTESMVRWLRSHIGWWEPGAGDLTLRTQIYNECVDILAELLDRLQMVLDEDDQNSATVLKLADLLPNLLEAYRDAMTVPLDSVSGSGGGGGRSSSGQSTSNSTASMSMSAVSHQIASRISISSTHTSSWRGSGNLLPGPTKEDPTGGGIDDQAQANSDTAKIASTFLSVFNLMSETRIAEYFVNVHVARGYDGSTKFLNQVLAMMESILHGEAYPSTWVNLNIIARRTALKIFRSLSLLMQHYFMPPAAPKFDQQLWTRFYVLVLVLLNSTPLGKDAWSAQRWRTFERISGRPYIERGAQLLKTLWKSLGMLSTKEPIVEYQLRMIPTLLPMILELTMSNHQQLCQAASYMLYSMIKREYSFCKSIKRLESFCIDHFDVLVLTRRRGDDTYRRTFMYTMCRLLAVRKVGQDLKHQVSEFLLNVDRFLILLLGLRLLPPGNEYEDEQWSGIYKLAKFMRAIGRTDIFLKYVHHLAIKQLNSNNFVEAGWTLKLHADMLAWSERILDAIPDLGFDQPQKESERKEDLLHQILVYFEEGKAWESAISVCKELFAYYDNSTYNYEKVAEMLTKQASLYQMIVKEQRYYSEYFRVGYYGMGFPASLRNKQFVYRGLEWEKLATFCERIQNKHPDSVLLKSNAAPGEETLTADGRFLQITTVVPEPDLSLPVFVKGDGVPEAVRSYFQFNDVRQFSVSRPMRKGPKTGNEFLDLWTEKTTYVTEDTFPHLLRRSEIIEATITEYSPVENAVQGMVKKNRELILLEAKYGKFTEPQANCSPLTMSINGSVDAPVNGGIPMYKKAFIQSNYREEYPDKAVFVSRLEEAIDEQVIILDRCIAIHNRIVSPLMRPLHDTIVSFFQKNFAEELERLGVSAQYEAPAGTSAPVGHPRSSGAQLRERPTSSLSNLSFGGSFNAGAGGALPGTPTMVSDVVGSATKLARRATSKQKKFVPPAASSTSSDDIGGSAGGLMAAAAGGGAGGGGSTGYMGSGNLLGMPSSTGTTMGSTSNAGGNSPGGQNLSPSSSTLDALGITGGPPGAGAANGDASGTWKRPGLLAKMRASGGDRKGASSLSLHQ